LANTLDIVCVNDTATIRKNDGEVSINSAVEIDLSGPVYADRIETSLCSGFVGQMDFISGAMLSTCRKPIIVLPSITRQGECRIVPFLKVGCCLASTRALVRYIVTEYGSVDLFGKTIK
jgi:4-hydroxybutyrate CoA-transferase